jgi:hypothetical protein
VGDYTRRFVAELNKLGHDSAALAIHDKHIPCGSDDIARTPSECLSKTRAIRFSSMHSWERRLAAIDGFLDEIRPDWTSFQYVPHGFHPKGLPWLLPKRLARLRDSGRRHLMFHELWVRSKGLIQPKASLLSMLQRLIARKLVTHLHPEIVHTSTPVYQSRLQEIGIHCGVLPLLSNIPIHHPTQTSRDSLLDSVLPGAAEQAVWIFVVFGSLRRTGFSPDLMPKLEAARDLASKSHCIVLSIGRVGEEGDSIWNALTTVGLPRFSFRKFGELPPEDVSSFFQCADFGIASTPAHLLGKSGSVSAMRSHGLPVICHGAPDFPADRLISAGSEAFLNSNAADFSERLACTSRGVAIDPAGFIARQFVSELQSRSSHHE